MFLAPTTTLQGGTRPMAGGMRGVRQTLSVMRQLIDAAKVDLGIRQLATSMVFLTPAKDEVAECRTLFNFVQSSVRYTSDVYGVETLQTPQITLAVRVGDCDDMTTLLCALFETVGHPTRLVVASYSPDKMPEHVYCQVWAGGAWIDCDPTEPNPMGWAGPDATAIFVEN